MPRLVSFLSKRKYIYIPLQKSWNEEEWGRVLQCAALQSKEFKSDFHSSRPNSAHTNGFTRAMFASSCTVSKLNCLHNTIFVIALIYLSSSVCFFSLDQDKNRSCFLCCLASSHFCHSYYFMKSDSDILFAFIFLFRKAQVFKPPMSTSSKCTERSAEYISILRSTLKAILGKISFPFQNKNNELCLFT